MMMHMAVTSTMILGTLLSVLSAASCGRMVVGGRTEIADAKTNGEVQELGRFSVEEYNRRIRLAQCGENSKDDVHDGGDLDQPLTFSEVVEAQKQVVSGMKYYLKISATTQNGIQKMFGSVVIMKPWLHSKQLLNFGPYIPSTSSIK